MDSKDPVVIVGMARTPMGGFMGDPFGGFLASLFLVSRFLLGEQAGSGRLFLGGLFKPQAGVVGLRVVHVAGAPAPVLALERVTDDLLQHTDHLEQAGP